MGSVEVRQGRQPAVTVANQGSTPWRRRTCLKPASQRGGEQRVQPKSVTGSVAEGCFWREFMPWHSWPDQQSGHAGSRSQRKPGRHAGAGSWMWGWSALKRQRLGQLLQMMTFCLEGRLSMLPGREPAGLRARELCLGALVR